MASSRKRQRDNYGAAEQEDDNWAGTSGGSRAASAQPRHPRTRSSSGRAAANRGVSDDAADSDYNPDSGDEEGVGEDSDMEGRRVLTTCVLVAGALRVQSGR